MSLIINIGGEKVSPIEVENIAQEFEQIRECGCIGVEDTDGILGYIPESHIVWATIGMGYPAGEVKSPMRKLDVVEWV